MPNIENIYFFNLYILFLLLRILQIFSTACCTHMSKNLYEGYL